MSVVTTRECDICLNQYVESRSRVGVLMGEYISYSNIHYEVCPACEARLVQPMIERLKGGERI